MVDMSGYLRTVMNGRSAAAEQFGSELPERRGMLSACDAHFM